MKRFALILLGCALIMGMSQCKKDNANTPNNEGVRITLTADGGQNSKTSFDGTTNFTWTNDADEYIYVGGSKHDDCMGVLSAKGNGTSLLKFEGTITAPDEGETLHFFYLGNGSHHDPTYPTSVSFANQTGALSNLTDHHIAIGSAEYSASGAYTAKLDMAMAIAWFNTSEFTTGSSITLSGEGIYNAADIDYKKGTITASIDGDIILSNGVSADCYVALLPYNTGGSHALTFTSESQTGEITFNSGIAAGDFYVSNPGSGASGLVVKPNNPNP